MVMMRSSLLVLPVTLVVILLCASIGVDAACSSTIPPRSSVLRIAMVVHGPPLSNPAGPAEVLPTNPQMLPASLGGPYFGVSPIHDKAIFQAAQLYDELMQAAGGLPLTDGTKMPVQLVYFNIGPVSQSKTNSSLVIARATTLAGLLANETGPYGRFPFILTQAFSGGTSKLPIQLAFMDACETSQTCITIGAISGEPDQYICPTPAPADCVARGRPSGSRRFKFGFSNFVDPTNDFRGHLTGARQQGIITTALLFDSVGTTAATYKVAQRQAVQVGIKVVYKLQIPLAGTLANLNLTADQVADALVALKPGSLMISTSVGQPSALDIANVLLALKARGWWPDSICFGGGVDGNLVSSKLLTADDLLYTNGMNPWSPLFQDTGYHAVNISGVNFELYPSTDSKDSTQIFSDAMTQRWGPPTDPVASYIFAAAITGALTIAQKLVEATLSDDAPTLSAAGSGLSAPSVWGLIQFDPYGRPVIRDAALYQNVPNNQKVMIYPPNIGLPAVYPIPQFEDRVFEPEYLSTSSDKIVIAVTSVALAYVAMLMVFVGFHWNSSVIRAATPIFCMLILIGCMILLASNYFIMVQSTDARCAAQYWLLTLGFTMTFAPLFIKTYRIWRIFYVKKLVIQRLPTSHLLAFLGTILAIDVVINAIWTGTGATNVKLIVPDALRPSQNILQCHTSDSSPYLLTHVALKGFLTLVGMFISWRVRKVDSTFNESFHSMLVIYNLAMVSVFVIPMVSGQVGGVETTMMIQGFAVIFISLATASIMFVPKYFALGVDVTLLNKTAGSAYQETTGTSNHGVPLPVDSLVNTKLAPKPLAAAPPKPTVRVQPLQMQSMKMNTPTTNSHSTDSQHEEKPTESPKEEQPTIASS